MLQTPLEETVASGQDTATQFEDLHACACPNKASDTEQAPGCQVERLLGENTLLLIVKPGKQRQMSCKKLIYFGAGHFCRCPQRIDYYKKYGL